MSLSTNQAQPVSLAGEVFKSTAFRGAATSAALLLTACGGLPENQSTQDWIGNNNLPPEMHGNIHKLDSPQFAVTTRYVVTPGCSNKRTSMGASDERVGAREVVMSYSKTRDPQHVINESRSRTFRNYVEPTVGNAIQAGGFALGMKLRRPDQTTVSAVSGSTSSATGGGVVNTNNLNNQQMQGQTSNNNNTNNNNNQQQQQQTNNNTGSSNPFPQP